MHLSMTDVLGIALSWLGAGTIAYFIHSALVAIACVAAAYYLSKWIILRQGS
ncbi:MAG: hypothetical protein Q7S53_02385 [bacterium]|nr:hypothetical protein [bacterium]